MGTATAPALPEVARQAAFRGRLIDVQAVPARHRQLDAEGVVQVLRSDRRGDQAPVLAAVGPMQFEVATARLQAEFGVDTMIEHLPYQLARRTDPAGEEALRRAPGVDVLTRVRDSALLAVFPTRWRLETVSRDNPGVRLEPLLADTDRTPTPARKGAA